MARQNERKSTKILKTILIVLLCIFSTGSVIFSLYVLFTDLGPRHEVTPAQSRGLFTVFIYENIDEVHPQKLPSGHTWMVKRVDFPNKNSAIVEAVSGKITTKLEFIYAIEYPNVRVFKINDISGRDLEDAQLAVIRYLGFLQSGDYENAASLYAGPVARLAPYGAPNVGLPILFQGYCTRTSTEKKCLPFTIKKSELDQATNNYIFTVTYQLADASAYTLADGKSEFTQVVKENEDSAYVVTTLPFD